VSQLTNRSQSAGDLHFPECERATRWECVILKGLSGPAVRILKELCTCLFPAATPSAACGAGDRFGIFRCSCPHWTLGRHCLPGCSSSPRRTRAGDKQRQRLTRNDTLQNADLVSEQGPQAPCVKLLMSKAPRTWAKKDSENHLTNIQANN